MKDIDFDELDKAVSAILIPKQSSAEPTSVTIDDVSSKKVPAVSNKKTPVASKNNDTQGAETRSILVKSDESEQTKQTPAAIITRRRSGKFMDVVHPDTVVKEDTSATTRGVDAPVEEKDAKFSAAKLTSEKEVVLEDESDITTYGELVLQPLKDWNISASEGDKANTSDEAASAVDSTVNVPFLPNSKVEKRPLGAFSGPASEVTTEKVDEFHATRLEIANNHFSEDLDKAVDDLQAQESNQTAEEAPEVLPRELESDIVAIESAEHVAQNKGVKSKPARAVSISDTTEAAPVSTVPTVAMSIPKQYKELSEESDTAQHSLFDTDEYHPPVKKHSETNHRRQTILWVIVALILLTMTAAGFGFWLYAQL